MGRVVHGASCPWGEMSVGRDVRGAKCPWGEVSVGRNVRGARCRGVSCRGASCLGASGPGTIKKQTGPALCVLCGPTPFPCLTCYSTSVLVTEHLYSSRTK